MPSILIVTVAYPPSRLIGGRRPVRMAAGLEARGWDVTVATLHGRYMQPLDPAPTADGTVTVLRSHALMPRVWLARQAAAATADRPAGTRQEAAAWRAGLGRWLRRVEFPDEYAGWLPLALLQLRGRRFDVVLATLPPPTVACIGAAVARRGQSRLVLDYRDPWCEVMTRDGSYGLDKAYGAGELALHRALEDRLLRRAELVLAVTPKMRDWLAPRAPCPVRFLANGLDAPPPLPPLPRARPLRLVYAGSLAYERSLDSVLGAIAALADEFPPSALRLAYAGPHGAALRQAAERLGVAAWLDDRGMLPHAEVLALYRGAAAGVVAVSARTDYSYPGKLFEILTAGCPILLCGPDDSEAARLVRELDVGGVDSGASPTASIEALRRVLAAPPPSRDLSAWYADAQMQRLNDELRRLL